MASSLQVFNAYATYSDLCLSACAFSSVTCSENFQVSFRDRSFSNIDSYLSQRLVAKFTDSRNRRARAFPVFSVLYSTSYRLYQIPLTHVHRDLMAPQRDTRRHLKPITRYILGYKYDIPQLLDTDVSFRRYVIEAEMSH